MGSQVSFYLCELLRNITQHAQIKSKYKIGKKVIFTSQIHWTASRNTETVGGPNKAQPVDNQQCLLSL